MSDIRRPRHDGQKPRRLQLKAHTLVVPAPGAFQMHQAVLEDAAAQVLLELPHHELRQPAASLLRPLHEARPVLAHELVEERLVRPPTRVAVRARHAAQAGAGALTFAAPRDDDELPSTAAEPWQAACRLRGSMTSRGYTTQIGEGGGRSADGPPIRRDARTSCSTKGRAGGGVGGFGSIARRRPGGWPVSAAWSSRPGPTGCASTTAPPSRPSTDAGRGSRASPGSLAAPGPRCVRRRRQELLRPRLPAGVRETEEVEVSGLPALPSRRSHAANLPNRIRRVLSGCSFEPDAFEALVEVGTISASGRSKR